MPEVIKCGLYDYFEIACMRRSQVLLELNSGSTLSGIAKNLVTREGKEFLLLGTENSQLEINLMDIDVLVFAKSGERISIS